MHDQKPSLTGQPNQAQHPHRSRGSESEMIVEGLMREIAAHKSVRFPAVSIRQNLTCQNLPDSHSSASSRISVTGLIM